MKMVRQLITIVVGGVSFWLPGLCVAQLATNGWSLVAANALAVGVPLGVYWLVRRSWGVAAFPAIAIAIGIYLLCPFAISLEARVISPAQSSNAFASWGGIALLSLSALVPPLAWIWAEYVGLVLGLLVVTAALIWLAVRDWKTA